MNENQARTQRYRGGNALLDQLPPQDHPTVFADVRLGSLEAADLLARDGSPIEQIVFPIDALISVTARLQNGTAYEVGTVGRQGALGAEVSFGVTTMSRAAICQVGGTYATMPRASFARHVESVPAFRLAVQRAYAAQLFAVEQSVTCNVAHAVGERAARWLLTVSHQVGATSFRLRTEFLAMMLGQPDRRSAFGLESLIETGAITYDDEIVNILDTQTLSEAACECYGALRAQWDRLVERRDGHTMA